MHLASIKFQPACIYIEHSSLRVMEARATCSCLCTNPTAHRDLLSEAVWDVQQPFTAHSDSVSAAVIESPLEGPAEQQHQTAHTCALSPFFLSFCMRFISFFPFFLHLVYILFSFRFACPCYLFACMQAVDHDDLYP